MKLTDASAHKCLLKGISSYGPKKVCEVWRVASDKKSFCDFCIGGHKIRIHIPTFLGSTKQSNVKNTENCALCACLMIRIRMKYQIDQSSFYLVLVPPRFLLNVCVSLINWHVKVIRLRQLKISDCATKFLCCLRIFSNGQHESNQ